MKLVGLLKGKVEKAETMEEKKDLIKEAGVELNDDELEGVAGGGINGFNTGAFSIKTKPTRPRPPKH